MRKKSSNSDINVPENEGLDRRSFLRAGLAGSTALAAGGLAGASGAKAAGLDIPIWSQQLGIDVDALPYGKPSVYESGVVRRSVDWLTATRESSINFTPLYALDGFVTPNGICFERHHGGAAEVDPAQHHLMINGMVDRALVVFRRRPFASTPCITVLFPGMRGQWRHGMA